jgi:hypothetical protein
LASSSPAIFFIVYFTHGHMGKPWVQNLVFAASLVTGAACLYIISRQRTQYDLLAKMAGVGTLWSYTLIQLDLLYACLALFFSLLGNLAWLLVETSMTAGES